MADSAGPDTDNPVIAELQKLQEQRDGHHEQHAAELEALRKKYVALYEPLDAARAQLVKGSDGKPGVERFWLTVLQQSDATAQTITEKDAEVLAFLLDIREESLVKDGEESGETAGFALHFEFAENPFFSETLLTKTYHMDDDDDVLDGAEGTPISWKPGKNVTVKVMKKKPKAGGRGAGGRTITKTEQVPSFFDFFSPPELPDEGTEMDEEALEELQTTLERDFELGDHIREGIIPHAVSWYTGEMQNEETSDDGEDDDDYGDEDDTEEEDSDDPIEEVDEEEVPGPGHRGGRGKARRTGGPGGPTGTHPPGAAATGEAGQKEECKQQ